MSLTAPKKHDQVFQLTLTELAFMLVFLLMLITGWMVVEANRKAKEAAEKLAAAETKLSKRIDEAQLAQKAAEVDKAEKSVLALREALKEGGYASPDEALKHWKQCLVLEPENRDLKARGSELDKQVAGLQGQVTGQDKQIAALTAFQDAMKALVKKDSPQAAADELATAMAFRKGFEDAAGRALDAPNAARLGWECVAARTKTDAMEKERQNLVNQVTFMRKQVEDMSSGTKGGFGPPPCWVDNGGKSQRLLAVEVTDQGLLVRPGWPAEREEEAKKLPSIKALTENSKAMTASEFAGVARPVLDWAKKRSPECRHYASVTISASRVDMSVSGQNAVFDHFFPYGRVTLKSTTR